jgi:hypothetical protein
MINYYQPFLWPFLQFKKNISPPEIKSLYYHSFEDALWDFIQNKFKNKKNITILVPDFYCSDVLDNLKLHGYKYIYYSLDKYFQISTSRFRTYLWFYQPDVVIIFNACGITSELLLDTYWLSDLPKHSWILQDNVHNLTNPKKIKLIDDRHIIIDSLRKVTPLPGSRMFGNFKALNFTQNKSSYFSKYFISSMFYYLLFRLIFIAGFIINSSKLVIWAHDYWLVKHDDIIGDAFYPQSGFSLFLPFIDRINYQKIYNLKIAQVIQYEKFLKPLYKSGYFYKIYLSRKDYGNLHVYPLGFIGQPDMKLEKYLENHSAPVWYKFTDVPWCKNRGVLFLPLGSSVNVKSIINLTTHLQKWL